MISSETKNHRRWLLPLAWVVAGLAALSVLLKLSPTAREVAGESSLTIFQIVTSPFVLEATLAFLGFCAVLAINHYRQQKEGDGWVYLQKREPSADADAETADPPHRHDAVVWHEKPDAFDEAGTELDIVEGYLDLGLADEALQELGSLPERLRRAEMADDLRIRALVMAGKAQEAAIALAELVRDHPERTRQLSGTALAAALWLHDSMKAEAGVDEWIRRSRLLHPAAFDSLPQGHPLRVRAEA